MLFPCCGVIIICNNKTVVVETHKGNYSFPKGKRIKGETDIKCAMRELFEETGISECHILDSIFDEFSEKGFPSVRYFVGTIENEVPLIFDNKELKSCSFIDFETRVLPKRRQEILDKVINLKKSHL